MTVKKRNLIKNIQKKLGEIRVSPQRNADEVNYEVVDDYVRRAIMTQGIYSTEERLQDDNKNIRSLTSMETQGNRSPFKIKHSPN